MNSTDTANVLEGQDAMDLYEQGRDAWNKWAKDHPGWTVDFTGAEFTDEDELSFDGFSFPGSTLFKSATFTTSKVSFEGAIFRGDITSFKGADFKSGSTEFSKTFFLSKKVVFDNSSFSGNVEFYTTRFYNHEISFVETDFEGVSTAFSSARFKSKDVSFIYTNFSGKTIHLFDCWFFTKSITFLNSYCDGDFMIGGTNFIKSKHTSFNGLKIKGSLLLKDIIFQVVPDFRNLSVNQPPLVNNMVVKYKTHSSHAKRKWAEDFQHSDMYRKLKSMAMEAKNHDMEIEFFAMEERAKRGWHKNWFQYLPTLLYDFFSDFGRSISRPFFWLIIVWLFSAGAFLCALTNTWSWSCSQIKNSLLLSASHLFPFFPWSRGNRDKLIKAISDTDIDEDAVVASVEAIAYLESFLALIFVFLIGLALRNRFRL